MKQGESVASKGGLSEVILTLPVATIAAMAFLLVLGFLVSGFILISGGGHEDLAKQIILVQMPMSVALVTAIGMRRGSSHAIDRLVSDFLDRVVRERISVACRHHLEQFYPFRDVSIERPSKLRSYAYYSLIWANEDLSPARVGVKMNVFNIEMLFEVKIDSARMAELIDVGAIFIINKENVESVAVNPLLKRFQSIIQGSVEEGYVVKINVSLDEGRMSFSIRQKVEDNILTSAYLKRYFAEDVAIAVGVFYGEWIKAGLGGKYGAG